MKKRGPVLVGAGVALLIASQFFDFGLGFQDGSGPGETSDPNAQVSIDPTLSASTREIVEYSEEDANAQVDVPRVEPIDEPRLPDVVDIVIDGNQYLVVADAAADDREAMTLDQIIAMAATVEGERSGIRVRVARTADAVASAEAAVMKRLTDAGLAADQIDARRQLVDAK